MSHQVPSRPPSSLSLCAPIHKPQTTSQDVRYVLYSDLTCPFCYALHRRLRQLSLMDWIEWRGIEHAPDLPRRRPTPPVPTPGYQEELDAARHLAPDLPLPPTLQKPNTRPLLALIAAIQRTFPSKLPLFLEDCYRAFWDHGLDLSSPSVLIALTRQAGIPQLPLPPTLDSLLDHWRTTWATYNTRTLPLLARADGRVLSGLVPIETLRDFCLPPTALTPASPSILIPPAAPPLVPHP